MELRPGTRLRSAVSEVEIIVIRAAGGDVDLRCAGAAMIDAQPGVPATASSDVTGSTALGKRYVDAQDTLEVLCTKPGAGTLSIADQPLELKSAKPLPSSD